MASIVSSQKLTTVFAAACFGLVMTPHNNEPPDSFSFEIKNRIDAENQSQLQEDLRLAFYYSANSEHLITIDSKGGLAKLGFEIVDDIENLRGDVTLRCEGRAASIAAVIFITPDNAVRDATDDCRIMIHRSRHDLDKYLKLESGRPIIVTRDELEPHYLSLMADSTIDSIEILPRVLQSNDTFSQSHSLSRAQVIALYDAQMRYNQQMILEISDSSQLTASDVTYLFTQGDVEFDINEAAFAGFLDTINGEIPTIEQRTQGEDTLCARYPVLTVCND